METDFAWLDVEEKRLDALSLLLFTRTEQLNGAFVRLFDWYAVLQLSLFGEVLHLDWDGARRSILDVDETADLFVIEYVENLHLDNPWSKLIDCIGVELAYVELLWKHFPCFLRHDDVWQALFVFWAALARVFLTTITVGFENLPPCEGLAIEWTLLIGLWLLLPVFILAQNVLPKKLVHLTIGVKALEFLDLRTSFALARATADENAVRHDVQHPKQLVLLHLVLFESSVYDRLRLDLWVDGEFQGHCQSK